MFLPSSLDDALVKQLMTFPAVRRVADGSTDYPAAVEWVRDLPAVLSGLIDEWHVSTLRPLSGGEMSVVFACSGGLAPGPAVLKLTIPGPQAAVESYALAAAGSSAAAEVYAQDDRRGALLMERLGAPLAAKTWSRKRKTHQLLDSLQALWAARGWDRNRLSSWSFWMSGLTTNALASWEATGRLCRRELVEAALAAVEDLAAHEDPTTHVLLMGDVHVGNLLAGSTPGVWKWIDLGGVYGPPEYDLGRLAVAQIPDGIAPRDAAQCLQRNCAEVAAATGLSADKVRAFTLAHLVLPAVWQVANGMSERGRTHLTIAEALETGQWR